MKTDMTQEIIKASAELNEILDRNIDALPDIEALDRAIEWQEEVIQALIDALYAEDALCARGMVDDLGLQRFVIPKDDLIALSDRGSEFNSTGGLEYCRRNPIRHHRDVEADAQRARIDWNHRIIRAVLHALDRQAEHVANQLVLKFQLQPYCSFSRTADSSKPGPALLNKYLSLCGAPDTFVPPQLPR